DGEDCPVPAAGLAPGQQLADLPGSGRERVGADDVGALASWALEGSVARLVDHTAQEAVHEDEAAGPRGQLGRGVVEQPGRPECAELRDDRDSDAGPDAVEDL